jgi:tetratricopeptide (TPR) repeat protein
MQQRGDIQRELIEIANALEQADLALTQGRYADAAVVYKQAFMALEHAYGVNDPDTIRCLQKLGDMYYLSERYDDALSVYKRLLSIGSTVLGTNHPDVQAMKAKVGNTIELVGGRKAIEEINDGASRLSHSSISALRLPKAQALKPDESARSDTPPDADHWTDDYQFNPDGDSESTSDRGSGTVTRGGGKGKQEAAEKPRKKQSRASGKSERDAYGETERTGAALRVQRLNPRDQIIAFCIANGGLVASLIVVVVLIVLGVIVSGKLSQQNSAVNDAQHAQLVAGRFKPMIYATADDARELNLSKLNEGSMKYPPNATTLELPVVHAGPDWLEFFAVSISCLTNKDIWFEETPFGLRDEGGVNYYAINSAEYQTAIEMRRVATSAQSWFSANQSYPQDSGFGQPFAADKVEMAYGSSPLISSFQLSEGQMIFGMLKHTRDFYTQLLSPTAQRWPGEQPLRPGAIHCLSLKRSDLVPAISQFCIQGCDRNGQLLTGSQPGDTYLIVLDQGKTIKMPKAEKLPGSNRLIRVCIATLPNGLSLRLIRGLFPLVLVILSAFIILIGRFSQPKSGPGLSCTPSDLFAIIMFMVAAFWAFFLFIAP